MSLYFKPTIKFNYTTKDVIELFTYADGKPCKMVDLLNQCRPGKPLEDARVRRGVYDKRAIDMLVAAKIRRRLARDLGRISSRYLEMDHALKCPECGAIAVTWEGKWKCEAGHTGLEAIP